MDFINNNIMLQTLNCTYQKQESSAQKQVIYAVRI